MLEALFHRARKLRSGKERGFTLVELLVVISILGILAAVVVFSVSGVNDRGQSSACQTDTSTLRTAEESFYASQKTSPKYGTIAQLQSGGFLSSSYSGDSTKYNQVAVTNGGASYSITAVGPCA